jgi:mannose-6-phosphate isomerase-like protein (cupin superfamily)
MKGMPIIKSSGTFPKWCEVRFYEIIRPTEEQVLRLPSKGPKQKLMMAEGACDLTIGSHSFRADQGEQYEIAGTDLSIEVRNATADAVLIRIGGKWGDVTGDSGFFEVTATDKPENTGDPADYPRNTSFDRHYHDCDEYYIIYEGSGTVYTEGKLYETAAGDCVVIGKGHPHDFPTVKEPVKAVYFESTLQGKKREGHLWNHTHGPAVPDLNRV